VTLTAGPFAGLRELAEFKGGLTSIPGVSDVAVQTFEGRRVIFEVTMAEPTPLIAALRAQTPRPLHLLHATDTIVRLALI